MIRIEDRLMRKLLLLLACTGLLVSTGLSAFEKPPFPRLATNWIGDQRYGDPAVQRQLARGSIALISVWPGWDGGVGTTLEQVIKNVKAINPNTLVFDYVVNNEISTNRTAYAAFTELYQKLDSSQWFLYSNGGCCDVRASAWAGAWAVNNTLMSSADGNGDHWVEWFAKWAYNKYAVPSPSLDGFYLDNVFWRPRVDGDYNRDGGTDSAGNAQVQSWLRQGLARHFTTLNTLMPGKFQMGNIGDWGDQNAVVPELQGRLNGGFIEAAIGEPWSVEEWGGWQAMMAWYRKSMSHLGEPKLGIFAQIGNPSDYQAFRYGLASCLLDDGYFTFNGSNHYGDAPAFDEYNAKLGNAVGGPSTSAWQNGVYRRDFENGIALVNPKGNGAKTITLEADFKRLSGSQAPSVNNGQTVRTLTLQDRDGIILLRTQAVTAVKPASPGGLTVQ
jgi:hypothetical protein